MARKTKEEAEKTKLRILNAALLLLQDQGYASTSLEQIARHAGVTRGAVYWHFKNKTELFETLLVTWLTPSQQLAEDYLVRRPPSLAHLKAYMKAWLTHIEQDTFTRQLFNIVFFKVEQVGDTKALLDQLTQQADDDLLRFQLYLNCLKQLNEIHSEAPVPMMASAISSYLMGLAQTWLSHPESYSLAEQADTLVNCFFKGYLPTSITSTSDNAP